MLPGEKVICAGTIESSIYLDLYYKRVWLSVIMQQGLLSKFWYINSDCIMYSTYEGYASPNSPVAINRKRIHSYAQVYF